MIELNALAQAIIQGQQQLAVDLTQNALDKGLAPKDILDHGLIAGMEVVGVRFRANEVFIPEVLVAARAMKMAMAVLEPELVAAKVEPVGHVLIGTVQGDLHDIGKNLVAMMLKGSGFKVTDLGVDVPTDTFVQTLNSETTPTVLALSALLTTTMPTLKTVVDAVSKVNPQAKIMVGGAPVTQAFAQQIGAHGYAADAVTAVEVCKSFYS